MDFRLKPEIETDLKREDVEGTDENTALTLRLLKTIPAEGISPEIPPKTKDAKLNLISFFKTIKMRLKRYLGGN